MRHIFAVAVLAVASLVGACDTLSQPEAMPEEEPLGLYDFPFVNPFAATVVGTPSGYRASLPERIREDQLDMRVFEDREAPEVFWYNDRLRFSLARQRHRAPLIFNIAGTGAGHNSSLMKVMQRAFYQAGFHVISLPSPTHSNFIVSASSTGVPGRVEDDAADLYRVMELAYERVKDRIEVSEFYLTGYSLGGWQAAFVAHLDEEAQVFDFSKVLLINPPVSLFSSIRILDHMLTDNVPGGTAGIDDFFDRVFNAFIQVYRDHEFTNFGEDFLYRAYTTHQPDDEGLAALIGLSFRLSSNNMAFTSDVMSRSGYVVPKSLELTNTSSLTKYFKVGIRLSFEDYLNQLFYPYFKARDPSLKLEDLIEEASLKRIEDYLVRSPKIGLLTNEDDIILAPGEIDYLREVFGERAKIFPTGGHCGNLAHRHVIAHMTQFFKG
jgi:predicted alpha/beta-fold hydrolase